jgi:hypothetical protein
MDYVTIQSKQGQESLCTCTQPLLRSIGFSGECLGLHYGQIHQADLGDGDGRKDEHYLARQYYFPVWGTCWESVAGLHMRFFIGFEHISFIDRWKSLPCVEAERLYHGYRGLVLGVCIYLC